MSEVLAFPNVRRALADLIDGTVHLGSPVRAVGHLNADANGALLGPFPLVHIYTKGGTEGYVDRVDRVGMDVYAPGEKAVDTLESIRAYITGDNIETSAGFLDNIRTDQVPEDVPYASSTLHQAVGSFTVTSRPI